jgi:hypothetical protein
MPLRPRSRPRQPTSEFERAVAVCAAPVVGGGAVASHMLPKVNFWEAGVANVRLNL